MGPARQELLPRRSVRAEESDLRYKLLRHLVVRQPDFKSTSPTKSPPQSPTKHRSLRTSCAFMRAPVTPIVVCGRAEPGVRERENSYCRGGGKLGYHHRADPMPSQNLRRGSWRASLASSCGNGDRRTFDFSSAPLFTSDPRAVMCCATAGTSACVSEKSAGCKEATQPPIRQNGRSVLHQFLAVDRTPPRIRHTPVLRLTGTQSMV